MPLSSLRILIVDDYEPLRWLKARLLRRVGAEVLEAGNGTQALRLLETEKVDAVLLDINLPDMSAMDLRNRLRVNLPGTPVPVVFTSASERHPALEGGDLFLQEPINAEELVKAIHKGISGVQG